MLSGFYTSIPIIQLHSIFKLLQIGFWVFVGRHTCFYITIKLPFVLTPRVGKLITIYHISLWRCYLLCRRNFYHVLLFHHAIDQLRNLLDIWHDLKVDNTMFQKDLFKDWLVPNLFKYGWYFDYLKDNTPTLEIPLKENIEPTFMETLVNFVETQVDGGRWKMTSKGKGKGKLKEKVIELPPSYAFVEPLN